MDFIIVIGTFLLVILSNMLFSYLLIKKTLRKLIVPHLDELGYRYVNLEKTGFFNTGSFRKQTLSIKPFNPNGNFSLSLYRYVIYQKNSSKKLKTTVRIDWNLFRKTKIVFKPVL